ncbi:MAG TPA: ATP synthase F1 subunit gamma [Bacteroidales bacterium]|nr:ATP synthase F1 subunit gamma [Lentimicrobiaceae bacterium]HOH99341.1 ATP synthase F1 subunit gamma [Bacteroidales bacterium]
MANLKEIRNRIASIKSTQQITAAMKMVAASKLRRAQNAILTLRPYAVKLQEILGDLTASMDADQQSELARVREPKRILLIVMSSNRGLCGAFNTNVIRAGLQLMQETYREQYEKGDLSLITIGRKASEFFTKRKYPVIERLDHLFDNLKFDQVSPLAEQLMAQFTKGDYDRIILVYNQFKNAATQKLVNEPFLPVIPAQLGKQSKAVHKDYILEPKREELTQELIPKILRIQLYKALLDSFAAEHGARMTAMHQATDNAKELLKELQLNYNKARQAAITNEILEIVSGANALKDG